MLLISILVVIVVIVISIIIHTNYIKDREISIRINARPQITIFDVE